MVDSVQVSILCFAYNHEKYIRQCLDGFLMQKDVTFEIIIHDDASTDHTTDIIREYEKKYPTLIKPIYQSKNQYSQNIDIAKEYMLPLITGKYVAICEGDDYWTDPDKLKKQYDALEENPDCFMCLHTVEKISEDGTALNEFLPSIKVDTGKITTSEFFSMFESTWLYHTSSYFFTAKEYILFCKEPPKFRLVNSIGGDFPTLLYFAYKSNIYYFSEVMSNYRLFSVSSLTRQMYAGEDRINSFQMRKKQIDELNKMVDEFSIFSNSDYDKELDFIRIRNETTKKFLLDDIFWYGVNNKDYKLLKNEFSNNELKSRGLSNKAILKLKLQSIFKFIK